MTLLRPPEAPHKRRRFTAEFKAGIVTNCQQPGASVARIALDHGLNANLVHKWIRASRQPSPSPSFLPIALPAGPTSQATANPEESIRIEIPRQNGTLIVNWPMTDAERCLRWLQELLR